MKTIKLSINGKDNLRFELSFHLNNLKVKICKKNAMSEWMIEYEELFTSITKDTNIPEILEKTFVEYLEKKSIENFWLEAFNGARVVEFKDNKTDES